MRLLRDPRIVNQMAHLHSIFHGKLLSCLEKIHLPIASPVAEEDGERVTLAILMMRPPPSGHRTLHNAQRGESVECWMMGLGDSVSGETGLDILHDLTTRYQMRDAGCAG